MKFDVEVQKRIDDAFVEELTERERRFISGRADGLSLGAAWSCAGYEYYSGWQRDARDFERQLVKRRAAIELPYREQMKAIAREQDRARAAIEREQQRAQTAPLRAKLCAGLWVILAADAGVAFGEDGKLSVAALKASGIGLAIRAVRVGGDGRLKSIQLHNKTAAARLLNQLA